MRKPNGYDEAEAYTGEFNGPGPLPAGLYVCKILNAIEETKNGKRFLVLGFDIVEGDYAGYYKAAYDMDSRADKKWRGKHYQSIEKSDGTCNEWFKGLITSIEESNSGYHWNWDENTLKGKKFGAIMRREEYKQGQFTTKVYQVRSVNGLKNATVPEDKLLDNTAGSPDFNMPPTPPAPTDADAPFNW